MPTKSQMTVDERPAATPEPPRGRAAGASKNSQKLRSESPCFPRQKSPHGVTRVGFGTLATEVIEEMAQLIVRAHERDSNTV
jgi:hypothetical protein